ncbi:aspartate aminotransferase/Glutamic oxaloacetic transaminase [Penicillium cf. griseofulvum]|nr:aspartate aminotransferase/Glutamic oxaloacetic transaminase [Penicillium cf. griseofulvum]
MTVQYLDLPPLAADIAFGLMANYDADNHPQKVSLLAGAYRDDRGLPWTLPCVKQAKERFSRNPLSMHEYLGIEGSPRLIDAAKSLTFGTELATSKNILSIQTVSGTGANHIAARFLATHLKPKQVFLPDPTWVNHKTIWASAGPNVAQKEYPYYSPTTRSVDFDGMMLTLETTSNPNDVVILQACAHNPTGVDLTQDQWIQVAELVKRKKLFVIFDSAYQGFATGDVEHDAWAVRHFTAHLFSDAGPDQDGPGLCVAQSFSKNLGLYGERVGVLHLVVSSDVSLHGARSHIVETVLGCPELRAQWQHDLDTMSSRIKNMRRQLRRKLEEFGAQGDWSCIESQIGMFSFTGLTKEQVAKLRDDYHIYLLPSGRLSICGLTENNIDYVAKSISDVVNK